MISPRRYKNTFYNDIHKNHSTFLNLKQKITLNFILFISFAKIKCKST